EISPLFRQKVVLIKDPEGIRIGIRRKVPADIPKDRVFVEPVQKNLRGEKRILIPLALRDAFLLGSHGEIELIREDDKKFLITKNPL
ncbi:MAG: hypothetical protein HYV78_00685, partial [Candidatus Wildermuthbacteria bacterium]|nr:hypothetical protein [Candidatus Wildermuthbacteria bacterium]